MVTTQNTNGTAPAIELEDAAQREAGRAIVIQYLNEAHAMEAALVTTLQAHITMTPRGSYRQLLERHLAETRRQTGALERRLSELGEGSSLIGSAVGLVETVVGQALALGKGPLDLLRGASGAEKLLKNAKDECATEALEIATYDALEIAAAAVGDEETAALARRHRGEEEEMLAGLRDEIPRLTEATVRERAGGEPSYDLSTTGAADNVRAFRSAAGRFAREDAATPDSEGADEPIPGYDTLNAGQVIARLPNLSAEQLDAVAARERAGRRRSTVLARVDVLRREADGSAARDLSRPQD